MKYKIINWESNFEGAKSKTYNNKTSCSIPCKHGLGYKRLIRGKNGPALFGAWCALIQVLSRHPKPRNGFLTDDGTLEGRAYNPDDLELLTDIPAKFFSELLKLCTSEGIGWVEVIEREASTVDCEGTIVDCEATIVPLNSDSDLDLDSNSNSNSCDKSLESDFESAWEMFGRKGTKAKAMAYWKKLTPAQRESVIAKIPAYVAATPEKQFRKDFNGWINPANKMWEDEITDRTNETATPQHLQYRHISNSKNPEDYML